MLKNLKPYEQAREDFAEKIARDIIDAQDKGIPQLFFEQLPDHIIQDLDELHYSAQYDGSRYCIKIL